MDIHNSWRVYTYQSVYRMSFSIYFHSDVKLDLSIFTKNYQFECSYVVVGEETKSFFTKTVHSVFTRASV